MFRRSRNRPGQQETSAKAVNEPKKQKKQGPSVIEDQRITQDFHPMVSPVVISFLLVLLLLAIFFLYPPLCPTSELNGYKFAAMVFVFAFFVRWILKNNKYFEMPKIGLASSAVLIA